MLRGAIEPDVQRSIRALFETGSSVGLTDSELLQRFLDDEPSRSTTALESLVHRHAPMVRRVCASILPNDDAASDAFQATFLVLARRANSIRRAESVGPWLFGVARRVSLRSRRDEARRRHVERDAAKVRPLPGLDQPEPDGEPAATLFAELDRLPDRYRDPIVLCYLEGLSHEQAASRLGCRLTTFRTRLARGKDRLRDRLTRRGLAPAAYAGLLSPPAGPAASVPTGWTAQAVVLASAARGPIIAGTVASLARAGAPTPILGPWKTGLAALVAAFGIGAVALTSNPIPLPPPGSTTDLHAVPPPTPPTPAWIAPPDDQSQNALINTLRCPSDEPTTIISLLPEGMHVRKGDLVCELDSAPFIDQITNQKITTERAKLDRDNAALALELAEARLAELVDHEVPQRHRLGELRVALARAEAELARETEAEAVERSAVGSEQRRAAVEVVRAELALAEAEAAVESGRRELRLREIELKGEVSNAGAVRISSEQRYELEKGKETVLIRVVEKCKLYAENDGVVRYSSPEIQEGATIGDRQPILSCAPNPAPDPPKEEPKR